MKQSYPGFFLQFIRAAKYPLKSLLLFFFALNGYSQQQINSVYHKHKASNPYLHELEIEKFFIHTNKTVYFPGEKIWFKAYVVNDTNERPSTNTTNLHINVYNLKKELINHQLLLVQNGKAHGQIELSHELPSGKYYIELTTQWNQNFLNNSHITEIDIIGNNNPMIKPELKSNSETMVNPIEIKNESKIQFFPESGFLLENIENVISFKSKNSVTGSIMEETTGTVVAKFESNSFGMGKFKLFIHPKHIYKAYINLNGKQFQVPLPQINSTGIVITKNKIQKNDDNVNFTLKTNNATAESIAGRHFYAVLHRKGSANAVAQIKFKKRYNKYAFNISKSNLFNGVNSITLFNSQNKPVSEYSFFYSNSKKNIQLSVSNNLEEMDSITLNISTQNTNSVTNLSISILPKESKTYRNNSSIKSEFLLAPYLKHANLNLNHILESEKNNENIELLVQTGRRKSFTSNVINTKLNQNNLLPPENGITIKGNVSSNIKDLKDFKVMLSSTKNGILLICSIGESNSFSFRNLNLKHQSEYNLALLNPDGKIVKTEFHISQNVINYKPSEFLEKSIEVNNIQTINPINDNSRGSLPQLKDVTILDEVEVKANKKKIDKWEENFIEPNIYENSMSQVHIIDDDQFGITIYDYLQRIPGIRVVGNNFGFSILSTRGVTSFREPPTMTIIYNDVIMQDTDILTGRFIEEFVAISVNHMGAMLGSRGVNGSVSFYTRNSTPFGTIKPNLDLIKSETEFGFDSSIKYQKEMMTFANEISKKYYDTVDWIPNIEINPYTPNQLKFHSGGHDNFKIVINGMDEDGNFVFDVIDISSTLSE